MKEFELVVLVEDVPELSLMKGDVGTIVMIHNNGEAYEVEFATMSGDTIAVTTLPAAKVKEGNSSQILHIRELPGSFPERKSA